MQKKIIVISKFYKQTDNSRANLAYKYFKESNYDVKVICSDFSHSKKIKEIYEEDSNLIIIKTKEYKKNISLKRIYSHIIFSLDTIKELKKQNCDLIYVILPPNILGYLVSKYCKRNNIKLITDIIDLWPEALPIPSKLKLILDKTVNILWKKFRTKTLESSDYILTESNYFYKKLKLEKYKNSKVILLKKVIKEEKEKKIEEKNKDTDVIKIAYLGNIGKIYDFESLVEISKKLSKQKKVIIEIIGVGEEKNNLLQKLDENQIEYNFYGPIYEEDIKSDILRKCNFGFNGYKNNTEVALSYKSIDYFSYGLPIINSAKGDTWDIVEIEKIGINYLKINNYFIDSILNYKKIDIFKFFQEHFSYESLIREMNEVIKEIEKCKR